MSEANLLKAVEDFKAQYKGEVLQEIVIDSKVTVDGFDETFTERYTLTTAKGDLVNFLIDQCQEFLRYSQKHAGGGPVHGELTVSVNGAALPTATADMSEKDIDRIKDFAQELGKKALRYAFGRKRP